MVPETCFPETIRYPHLQEHDHSSGLAGAVETQVFKGVSAPRSEGRTPKAGNVSRLQRFLRVGRYEELEEAAWAQRSSLYCLSLAYRVLRGMPSRLAAVSTRPPSACRTWAI